MTSLRPRSWSTGISNPMCIALHHTGSMFYDFWPLQQILPTEQSGSFLIRSILGKQPCFTLLPILFISLWIKDNKFSHYVYMSLLGDFTYTLMLRVYKCVCWWLLDLYLKLQSRFWALDQGVQPSISSFHPGIYIYDLEDILEIITTKLGHWVFLNIFMFFFILRTLMFCILIF